MPSCRARATLVPFGVWTALPIIAAAWLRLRGIAVPEPFVDEGANILTALDPRVRVAFEPLEQGRPWLVHLFAPASWLPAHALEVARVMAAAAGLATLGALGWTLHNLAGRAAALAGMWLWALLPIAVFHERLALQDPFVTALLAGALACLAAGRLAARNLPRGAWLAAAGVCFGAAFLLKISAAFALPWLGMFFVALQRQARRPIVDRGLLWVVAGALAPLLSLGPGVARLGGSLDRYQALAGSGAGPALTGRLREWMEWYFGYGGWPLLLLAAAALALAARARQRLALVAAAGWLTALLMTGLFYHNLYARYLLPDHLPLIFFLALAWASLLATAHRLRPLALALGALALARWGFVAHSIGSDPARAAVPLRDLEQYFTGPWSGRGLADVRRFLDAHVEQGNTRCLVLTHRFLRPGCYGLLLHELGDARIGVVPQTIYEPQELADVLPGLRRATAGQRVAFFLLYEGSLYPAHPWLDAPGGPVRRVLTVPRGPGEQFTLFQFDLAAPPAPQ